MMGEEDSLFLLEVLVDKLTVLKSPCFSDKDFLTCVRIECGSVDPLEIYDDDPGACVSKSGTPFSRTFNIGKSCLFSLRQPEITAAMTKFPVKVIVSKQMACGCLPSNVILGTAEIDMTKEFVETRNKIKEDPKNVSYQALKDTFRLKGTDGQESGTITMFLRISCFGKLIVTRFQGSSGPPSLGAAMRYSNTHDRSCNPPREFQNPNAPCVCRAARSGGGAGGGGASGAAQPCAACGRGVCPPATTASVQSILLKDFMLNRISRSAAPADDKPECYQFIN